MDLLLPILASALVGYLINKIEKMENRLNEIEDMIIRLELLLPKRKLD